MNLVKGQDYELIGGGDEQQGTIELVNPAGTTTVTIQGNGEQTDGREFRAAYTATYQIRLTGNELAAAILADCRADAKTLCTLAPGATKQGINNPRAEADWYKAALTKGRTYTFTLNVGQFSRLLIVNGAEQTLAKARANAGAPGVIRYRAPASGAYYAVVTGAYQYTIGMK